MRVYIPFGTQWYPYLMRRLAERPANIAFILGNVVRESVPGGERGRRWVATWPKHERAAAFGGSDGQAYSVGLYVDEEPDERGRYGAALLFVRWSPAGDRPVGHVETEHLAWGADAGGGGGPAQGALAVRREGRARRGDRRAPAEW